jgi:FkbM family methyltransferase
MAAWCRRFEGPLVFDVGANDGFIATQLAQMLSDTGVRIYAFEPIPSTFTHLLYSISKLQLADVVSPICCALSDVSGVCTLSYDPSKSLFAQVGSDGSNQRVGTRNALACVTTLNEVSASLGVIPALVKVDVEGEEKRVLSGASQILQTEDPPAIMLEWNPVTLAETGTSPLELASLLEGYRLFYVDDFEGQRSPFCSVVNDVRAITWVCNIFAVPTNRSGHWENVRDEVISSISTK